MASTRWRYVLAVLAAILTLHLILSSTHEEYGRATSLANLASKYGLSYADSVPDVTDDYYIDPASYVEEPAPGQRANATLLMLTQDNDVRGAVQSIKRLEDRFNRRYRYPWTVLSDVELSEKTKDRLRLVTDAEMTFGIVPREHWHQPEWIDEQKAYAGRVELKKHKIVHGESVPYRNMCRFQSGFFHKHPLVEQYRWYWRVEADVHFPCDVPFDPFLYMQEYHKVYSFTFALQELRETVATLWDATKEFMAEHPEHIVKDNTLGFVSDDGGNTYNLCHFWSNFEIADMEFFRGEAYQAYFDHLDQKGGFYYERWGDAPVHSIAASLFLRKDQVLFFDRIGYEHSSNVHCPRNIGDWKEGRCVCSQRTSFDYSGFSCLKKWEEH